MSISATLRRVLTFFSIDREDEVAGGDVREEYERNLRRRWTPLMESRFMQIYSVHSTLTAIWIVNPKRPHGNTFTNPFARNHKFVRTL